MPPPRGTPNMLEGPGDYDVTLTIHNDIYPAISPTAFTLTNKTVFITGRSKGIGRSMALSYAPAGATHIAVGARSPLSQLATDIEAAAKSANRSTPTFLPVQLDVTDPNSVSSAASIVHEKFGKLDIPINNAGIIGSFGLTDDVNPDAWWDVLTTNLRGTYLVTRAFLPLLLKSETKTIISVTSVGALLVNPNLSAYHVSKMGLLKFAQQINAEYAPQGVISFAIHPGNCPTDIMGGPNGVPPHLKDVLVETPSLSANTLVYLTSTKRPWLGGRYINRTWDMPEPMAKEDENVRGDKLKVKLVYEDFCGIC